VVCVDLEAATVDLLLHARTPFHEPHVNALLEACVERIAFTTEFAALRSCEIVFLAVGTPESADGSADLRQVDAAASALGPVLGERFAVIANKSTVPVGTADRIESLVRAGIPRGAKASFAIASNPEFLRQGSALHDTFYPDRIVLGTDDARARALLIELHAPLIEQSFAEPPGLPRPPGRTRVPVVTTNPASAELIKYGANAFLALKISFINELAELAELGGADIERVADGVGLDERIGPSFLRAGIGWGGPCQGKDTSALVAMSRPPVARMQIVQAAREVNCRQRERVVEKLAAELTTLEARTIGLLGVAFKPGTDDIADSPSLDLAARLIARGARVRVHDPVALARARRERSDLALEYCDDVLGLASECDALVLVTEWEQYRAIPWHEVARELRQPIVLDARNALSRTEIESAGLRYVGMGR
jgi:UDPglucose 6-dehydrogenase